MYLHFVQVAPVNIVNCLRALLYQQITCERKLFQNETNEFFIRGQRSAKNEI